MVEQELSNALERGLAVRIHAKDGEVLVARVLQLDRDAVRFAVVTSSRPERYAVCDSTGYVRRLDELERAVALESAPRRPPGRRAR